MMAGTDDNDKENVMVEKGKGGWPLTKSCTWVTGGHGERCGAVCEDYEWETGEYWCDTHAVIDRLGAACMHCGTVLQSVEDGMNWYMDNLPGQFCGECEATRPWNTKKES